mmetsp:Transcript_24373/g.34415  ORF Transcript_24373/g.34415 Transcript_24373/m.34415 type:complete len:92 (+) Transcript_24373:14-289(+)
MKLQEGLNSVKLRKVPREEIKITELTVKIGNDETPASDSLSGKRIQVPVEAASPPRFDIVEERKESMEYLAEHGYVVIKGVATKDQVEQAR